eukprot:7680228-Heterocapsa_arctica.AAC.1
MSATSQEVGYKPFTTGDTLSAVSFLSTFLATNQYTSILAAHNNLIRAMAFAIEHLEEPPESIWNRENSNDFTFQAWSRYKSNSIQSGDRSKALIQYRQAGWSLGIQPGLRKQHRLAHPCDSQSPLTYDIYSCYPISWQQA